MNYYDKTLKHSKQNHKFCSYTCECYLIDKHMYYVFIDCADLVRVGAG